MNKRGLISISILLGFLILAPMISYIYLQRGYDYRKAALEDLQVKGEIQPFKLTVDSTHVLDETMLQGKVAVISRISRPEEWSYLAALYHQYKARPQLEFWTFSGELSIPDTLQNIRNWKHIRTNDSAFKSFRNQLISTAWNGGDEHILTDTSMHIRNIYPVPSEQEQIRLIEHLAIVLPRTKKSDVIYELSGKEK